MPKNNSKKDFGWMIAFFVIAAFLIFFLMNKNTRSMYTLEFPGRYRTATAPHPGSYGWKYSNPPIQCNSNYGNCMKGCEIYPRINCPGDCLEQKEYCQEYSS